MTERRAEEILNQAGIECEGEPDWVTEGRKPDFFCSGKDDFWCEVKTFRPQKEFELLGDAFEQLRGRAENIGLKGRGMAWVSDRLDQRDAKVAMNILDRGLRRLDEDDGPDRLVALIPKEPIYNEFVRFSVSSREHRTVEFHSCVSSTDRYEHPYHLSPEPRDQVVFVEYPSGKNLEVSALQLFTFTDDFRVAAEAWRDKRVFDFISTMPTGVAKELKNPDRIRDAVNDANNQFKNAVKYKKAPCLLAIFHDAVDVPEDEVIKSALYGDLKYIFPLDRSHAGKLILDGNGAWNEGKNRTTSAVMFVRNNANPIIIHNYWAECPLEVGILPYKEVIALDNGDFKEIEK